MAQCLRNLSWPWLLVHLACAAALLVQLGSVLWYGYIQPTVPNTVAVETSLKDMDFPVVFKVCVSPGYDAKALKEAGYNRRLLIASVSSLRV
jgi:hypothetical protein